jgi:hypothetical protein
MKAENIGGFLLPLHFNPENTGDIFFLRPLILEAVSRWLPTAATRVRARVWQVGFVVDKVA